MFGQILSRGRAVVDLFAMLVSHAYIARRSRSTVARFINEESSTARLVVGFSRSRSIRGGGIYIYIFIFEIKYFGFLFPSCDYDSQKSRCCAYSYFIRVICGLNFD